MLQERRRAGIADRKGTPDIERLAEHFWTFRGHFRLAGIVDLGTQMSLVRRDDGSFVLLDSYNLEDEDRRRLLELTDGGKAVAAILNLHPFHTLHCEAIHDLLPHAKLYGTARHHAKQPALPWEPELMESTEAQGLFSDTFEFDIPRGVDFISADEKVHVASVLARHRTSRILHVDDTINVFKLPGLLRLVIPGPRIRFHPMLGKALQQKAGAGRDYANWARELAKRWADTTAVCAAHSAIHRLSIGQFERETLAALDAVENLLTAHDSAFA